MICSFVIFGITGDLASRKIVPALYELARAERLPEEFFIIGFARRDWDDEAMRTHLGEAIHKHARNQPVDPAVLKGLLDSMHYVRSAFDEEGGYH